MIFRNCPLHGSAAFLTERYADLFDREHADCKWPKSTRRFPAKSRKRVCCG